MSIIHYLRRLKHVLIGIPQLKLISTIDSRVDSVSFMNDDGDKIRIYCTERIYDLSYTGIIQLFNKTFSTYSIYGVGSNTIPSPMLEALNEPFVVPALLPHYHSSLNQKKAIVRAYVSYIHDLLKKNHY